MALSPPRNADTRFAGGDGDRTVCLRWQCLPAGRKESIGYRSCRGARLGPLHVRRLDIDATLGVLRQLIDRCRSVSRRVGSIAGIGGIRVDNKARARVPLPAQRRELERVPPAGFQATTTIALIALRARSDQEACSYCDCDRRCRLRVHRCKLPASAPGQAHWHLNDRHAVTCRIP
jgi:hypothetical protein